MRVYKSGICKPYMYTPYKMVFGQLIVVNACVRQDTDVSFTKLLVDSPILRSLIADSKTKVWESSVEA